MYICLTQRELDRIPSNVRTKLMERFLKMHEAVYGKANCTYNLHAFSHFARLRKLGNLNHYSAVLYESSYSPLLRAFVAGTTSIGKQAFENLYIRKKRHRCVKRLRVNPKTTSCVDDSILYKDEEFFKVINLDNDVATCLRMVCTEYSCSSEMRPRNLLDWDLVHVFDCDGETTGPEVQINVSEFTGKGILCRGVMTLIPTYVLFEGTS